MPWTDDFVISAPGALPRTVHLLDASRSASSSSSTTTAAAACNASLRALVRRAQDEGTFAKTLGRKAEGEDFRIMGAAAADYGGLVQLRRSAASLLGVANRGAHMTVYTRRAGKNDDDDDDDPATAYRFWVPRRSAHLATYPGMLDNTVAGGVRAEETPRECILHEADEEASLPADFVRRHARAVGAVTYITQTGSGGGADADAPQDVQSQVGGYDAGLCVPDVLYCYDLEIPADQVDTVVPAPRDDEVEQFYLWTLDETKAALARGEFKPNTALVLLDFFIRHGILTEENEPDFVEILARLHRKLPMPTTPPPPAS